MNGTGPIVLGLTGSIGMGKSTTAAFFREAGADVWDADQAVHRLYGSGGAAVEPMAGLLPGAIVSGAVDRDRVKQALDGDPALLSRIEAIVHPLVQADRQAFIAQSAAPVVVCDIPLLFETGAQDRFDHIVVVTAPAEVQAARVLARPGMTRARFDAILARQMPDADKRARADYVIDTSLGLEEARRQVGAILDELKAMGHARDRS